jgi:hypothetical protein
VPGLRGGAPRRARVPPEPTRFLHANLATERRQVRLAGPVLGHDEPGFLGEGGGQVVPSIRDIPGPGRGRPRGQVRGEARSGGEQPDFFLGQGGTGQRGEPVDHLGRRHG